MAAANISILTLGFLAAVDLTQNQAVTATGAIATAAGNAIGFAKVSVVAGERVAVTVLGTAIAVANAAIAVGAALEVVGTTGNVTTKTSGIVVARALTAAAAQGDQIEVLVIAN